MDPPLRTSATPYRDMLDRYEDFSARRRVQASLLREAFGVRAYYAAFLCPPVPIVMTKRRNTRALQTLRGFDCGFCRAVPFVPLPRWHYSRALLS